MYLTFIIGSSTHTSTFLPVKADAHSGIITLTLCAQISRSFLNCQTAIVTGTVTDWPWLCMAVFDSSNNIEKCAYYIWNFTVCYTVMVDFPHIYIRTCRNSNQAAGILWKFEWQVQMKVVTSALSVPLPPHQCLPGLGTSHTHVSADSSHWLQCVFLASGRCTAICIAKD